MNNTFHHLTKNDYDDINCLLNVTNLILDTYNDICTLEMNNNINSRQFNDQIERLKGTYTIEQNYYGNLCSTCEKNEEVINYIRKNYNYNEKADIFTAGKKDIIARRILNKLQKTLLQNQILSLLNTKEVNLANFSKRSHYLSYLINMSLEDDIIKCSLFFLQHKIKDNYFKQELLKYKYKLIFSTIESEKSIEQYIFSDKIYLSTDLLCSLYGISDRTKKIINDQYLTNQYHTIFNYIHSEKDIDLVKRNEITKTTILLCRLKADLCLLDIKVYEELYDQYQQLDIRNPLIQKLIDEIFKINREDMPFYTVKIKVN